MKKTFMALMSGLVVLSLASCGGSMKISNAIKDYEKIADKAVSQYEKSGEVKEKTMEKLIEAQQEVEQAFREAKNLKPEKRAELQRKYDTINMSLGAIAAYQFLGGWW